MRGRAALALLVGFSLVVSTVPGLVAADVRGKPDLSATASDNQIAPGQEATLAVTVLNTGIVTEGSARNPSAEQRVTTARGTTLRMRDAGAPLSIETGTVGVGSVADGAAVPTQFRISVDEDAEPGTYELPLVAEYTYTSRISGNDSENHETRTTEEVLSVEVEVTDRDDRELTVESVDTSVTPGANGLLTLSLTNTANRTLADAAVRASSPNAALTFRGAQSAQTFVGEWEPGETREVPFGVALADGATVREYAVEVSARYTDAAGNDAQTEPLLVGVHPDSEQSLSLRDAEGTLRVGAEGEVTATLVNDGPAVAENAVLVLSNPGRNVQVGETEYAVGTLAPGDTAEVSYDVEVSSSAREGPRQFTFDLRYEDAGGDSRQSGPVYLRTDVAERRPDFTVHAVDGNVTAGSSTMLEVEVTNNRDEPVTDVSAKLFADAPLSSSDDEAFVDDLAPGETRTVRFEVRAAGSAIEKTYPLSMDFQYDDTDGDTLVSDTYKVPIRVQERKGGGGILSLAPLGGGLLALLLGGTFVLRR